MKILYVYENVTGDEKAITKALQRLGHEVTLCHDCALSSYYEEIDLLLFNHSKRLDLIQQFNVPKVFWYFDLLISHDPEHERRDDYRQNWAIQAMSVADLGFFTDGEWVEVGNLANVSTIRLTQGAQETGVGCSSGIVEYDILLACSLDTSRRRFTDGILTTFPDQVHYMLRSSQWVYEEEFANTIASSKIVIAPDTPIKSNYWSNRVYMILGYGGFLLHPYTSGLAEQYKGDEEIVFYSSRQDLYGKISYYLEHEQERQLISSRGLERTRREHTYFHRCKALMDTIGSRLHPQVTGTK